VRRQQKRWRGSKLHFQPWGVNYARHSKLTNFAKLHIFTSGGLHMATMNVSLPEQMKDWVEAQSKDGTFSNASDYVRHLIRQDRERQQAIAELQAEIDKGINSGIAEEFDFDEFIALKRAKRSA